MRIIEIIEGVVSEYNGKYWGKQEWDYYGFGDFKQAMVSDLRYCKKPTDMTSKNIHSSYSDLSKAKLIHVKKTITTEFEILE